VELNSRKARNMSVIPTGSSHYYWEQQVFGEWKFMNIRENL